MNAQLNYAGVLAANWQDIAAQSVADGIYERLLWQGENGSRALVYEFSPGTSFGVDAHEAGPEQIYVISGVFNDGRDDHPPGSFIHNPAGSVHVPQSAQGCVVLVIYPQG